MMDGFQVPYCRRFRFIDEKSDKFWDITLEETSYTVQFGRSGTTGQSQTKSFNCQFEEEGQECRIATVKAYLKAIQEKLKKGYVEVEVTPETRKFVVRSFFEDKLVDYYLETEEIINFSAEHRIAKLSILSVDDEFDQIESTALPPNLPQLVSETYQRYVWYSQYSLLSLALLKIPIEGQDAYAVLVNGFSGDGWDNGGMWLEVFDAQGQFLGGLDFWQDHEQECEFVCKPCRFAWADQPFDHTIFNSPTPPWAGVGSKAQFPDAVWSEELLAHCAERIETEGSITRYFLPEDDPYLLDAREQSF